MHVLLTQCTTAGSDHPLVLTAGALSLRSDSGLYRCVCYACMSCHCLRILECLITDLWLPALLS